MELLKFKTMTVEDVKKEIREVPDFPQKGILFRDFTTAFKNPSCMKWFENNLVKMYAKLNITKVVGIESRGFIMAPILANKINAGFVPIRKRGKLPADIIEVSYTKEYGVDTIQIHKDALSSDDIVLLHDDLLATGGTMEAAYELIKKFGVKKIYINFLAELDDLNGRSLFDADAQIDSLIHY